MWKMYTLLTRTHINYEMAKQCTQQSRQNEYNEFMKMNWMKMKNKKIWCWCWLCVCMFQVCGRLDSFSTVTFSTVYFNSILPPVDFAYDERAAIFFLSIMSHFYVCYNQMTNTIYILKQIKLNYLRLNYRKETYERMKR